MKFLKSQQIWPFKVSYTRLQKCWCDSIFLGHQAVHYLRDASLDPLKFLKCAACFYCPDSLSINSALDSRQSGFQPMKSIGTHLNKIPDGLLAAKSKHLFSILIFPYLSAAFDSLDHSLLFESPVHAPLGLSPTSPTACLTSSLGESCLSVPPLSIGRMGPLLFALHALLLYDLIKPLCASDTQLHTTELSFAI